MEEVLELALTSEKTKKAVDFSKFIISAENNDKK
jgi:hypothetical protein